MKIKPYIHIAFWLFLIFIETLLYWGGGFEGIKSFWKIGLHNVVISVPRAVAAYAFVFWLLPKKIIKNKRPWHAAVKLFAFLGASLLFYRMVINYISYPLVIGHSTEFSPFDILLSSYSFIRLLTPMALVYAIESIINRYQNQRKTEALEKARLESELQYLKAQVHPHFLFNTLNNIYVLAKKNSEKTAPAVSKLSKLLRFMLYESAGKKVPLKNELEVVGNYLELEKLRYSDRLDLIVEKKINDPARQIAPLILLPFIENAFKHGASESSGDIRVFISMEEKKGAFVFYCENSMSAESEARGKPKGVGLANVTRRLDLIYENKYELEIKNSFPKYTVRLKLDLNG